ncbi:unnamed protein product, partial [Vitrella brassicaformis CCMP3155]
MSIIVTFWTEHLFKCKLASHLLRSTEKSAFGPACFTPGSAVLVSSCLTEIYPARQIYPKRHLPKKNRLIESLLTEDLVPRQHQDPDKSSAPLLQLLVVTPLMAILVLFVALLIGSASAGPVSQGNTVRRHAPRSRHVTSADGPDDVDTSVHQGNLTSNTSSVLSVLENTRPLDKMRGRHMDQ